MPEPVVEWVEESKRRLGLHETTRCPLRRLLRRKRARGKRGRAAVSAEERVRAVRACEEGTPPSGQ